STHPPHSSGCSSAISRPSPHNAAPATDVTSPSTACAPRVTIHSRGPFAPPANTPFTADNTLPTPTRSNASRDERPGSPASKPHRCTTPRPGPPSLLMRPRTPPSPPSPSQPLPSPPLRAHPPPHTTLIPPAPPRRPAPPP